jgi:hypothetical protein
MPSTSIQKAGKKDFDNVWQLLAEEHLPTVLQSKEFNGLRPDSSVIMFWKL